LGQPRRVDQTEGYTAVGLEQQLDEFNEQFLRTAQGLLVSWLAAVAFNRAVALLGPSPATAIIALLPVVTSLLAIPVLGQVPLPAQWVVIIVIGMGVCLAAKRLSVRSAFLKRPT
jgi:hypothetical protein